MQAYYNKMQLTKYMVVLWGMICASAAGGFLMIPPSFHGRWVVPDNPAVGYFTVDPEHVSAAYRSAELKLTPQKVECLHPDLHELHLGDVEVIKRPSVVDIRRVWKGISYYHALQTHGILVKALMVEDGVMHADWCIDSKYSGKVVLVRVQEEE